MMEPFLARATSRRAISIKLSRLCQPDLRPMNMEFVVFGTMSRPYVDHVRTMFGLALLPDQLDARNFQD